MMTLRKKILLIVGSIILAIIVIVLLVVMMNRKTVPQVDVVPDDGLGIISEPVTERSIPKIEEKLGSDHKRGWGLQLIQELMDTVEFESSPEGTTVTMTKKK